MLVYIGPYHYHVGPYQIAGLLKIFGASESRVDKIGEYLEKTWVNDVCEWVWSKRTSRREFVHIRESDVWDMRETLSLIILPMLKKLKSQKHGVPSVYPGDVPKEIRDKAYGENRPEGAQEHGYHTERWDWVMDQMIWTFEQLQPGNDWESLYYKENSFDNEGYQKHHDRIQKGLRLFGKYYTSLWD